MAERHKTVHESVAHKDTVAKKPAAKAHHKTKTIKIKHHHVSAYRKRHVSALFVLIILSSILITWLLVYHERVTNSVDSAQNYISDVFNPTTVSQQNVSSTYGFSLSYDARTFNASAIDASTGDLFIGQELGVNRAYQTIRISTDSSSVSKNSQRSLTISYLDDKALSGSSDAKIPEIEKEMALNGLDASKASVIPAEGNMVTIGGIQFKAVEWKVQPLVEGVGSKVPVQFRTYIGVVNGKALFMKLTYGLSTGKNRDVFKPVVDSMKFGARKQAVVHPSKTVAEKTATNRSLIDTVFFTHMASAAAQAVDASEEISSRYSPTVIKVYNVYCMDINIDGKAYDQAICDGGTGSGFFLDGEGDIATNGHVASADPLDIVISDAVAQLINGNETSFDYLANVAGVKDSDFTGKESTAEIVDIAVNKMYSIGPTRIVAVNNIDNMLVGLNEKQPDLNELIKVTKNRQAYAEQDSVKQAKLVAKDYRAIDGIIVNGTAQFKASDVALIKISGNNYPVAKLGSIDGVSQGAGLLILGYPGEASDNGLVDGAISKPTLTAGKVSSIKTVSGSTKKLIETDATIGHGNSGGPVFDNSGNVIGIATYTIDGSGQGNGTYNYIRDIQDLKDLASKNSINVNVVSKTQEEWGKGIDLFYKAHYSKAVKSFAKVKKLYPQHPKADELIAAANERIKSGQDVKDFPYILVAIASVSVIGIGVTGLLIYRHRKGHKVYMGQVAGGHMQPMAPGAQPQMVSYNPANYTAMAGQQGMPMGPAQPMQQQMPAQASQAQMQQPGQIMPNQQPSPQVFGPTQPVQAPQRPRKIQ